ncbi:glycosyltransferase family 4 protein [Cetobacterium sp.]|uniref:glycosyltransferase family 4 protein n=1 Tax=Cetobacterium sp. TaxID=2071632 RepID=UPI003F2B1A18
MKFCLMVTTVQDTISAFLIPHIKMLEKNGYEVWIATNIYKEKPIELKNNRWINISFSRNPFSKNSFKAVKEMRKLIKENSFEIVHFHTPVAAFLGRYAAMLEQQKNVIYTAHGFHFYKGAHFINWCIYYSMELLAARWTDKLITINEEDYKRSLKFKLRAGGKCYKVPGVGLEISKYKDGNSEKIKKELLIREPEKVVLMIGELNKNKNQVQLIEALEKLRLKGKNVKGIFVGIGYEEKMLKSEALKRGVKISFLGYRKDIDDIIASADIVCSLSYREGLPRNLMEAMSAGKPIVATEIRGNRDIIQNSVNGFLVPVGDSELTYKYLLELLTDRELYKKVSDNNFLEVEKYSVDKILDKMKEVYGIEEASYCKS